MIRQTKLKMIWSKECITEIRPYSFMGAGEEVNGRQLTLTLVVGMKLLQNSKTNSQEEKLHVNWGRGRTNWEIWGTSWNPQKYTATHVFHQF